MIGIMLRKMMKDNIRNNKYITVADIITWMATFIFFPLDIIAYIARGLDKIKVIKVRKHKKR